MHVCLLNIVLVFRKTILRNICVTNGHGYASIIISLTHGCSEQEVIEQRVSNG